MDWKTIAIVLLVAWAIYHTLLEARQDKRIEAVEHQLEK